LGGSRQVDGTAAAQEVLPTCPASASDRIN
jgi:hypothetical protein